LSSAVGVSSISPVTLEDLDDLGRERGQALAVVEGTDGSRTSVGDATDPLRGHFWRQLAGLTLG
jgi:hypothetical protein